MKSRKMKLVQFFSDFEIQIVTNIMIIIYAIISPMISCISHYRPSIIVIHVFLAAIYFYYICIFACITHDPNLYESVQTCRTYFIYLR